MRVSNVSTRETYMALRKENVEHSQGRDISSFALGVVRGWVCVVCVGDGGGGGGVCVGGCFLKGVCERADPCICLETPARGQGSEDRWLP